MHFSHYGMRGQIFTHIDARTGEQTIFAATDIRRMCDRQIMPKVMIPVKPREADMIIRYRGIEDYRVLRALGTKRWLPLLFVHMPDGTQLLIDGSHTYVARAMLGHKWALAYIVPQEDWCYFTVDGFPEVTEDELANSWSGIR